MSTSVMFNLDYIQHDGWFVHKTLIEYMVFSY